MSARAPDINFELRHRLHCSEALLRCFEADAFARSVVQSSSDGVAVLLSELAMPVPLGTMKPLVFVE